MPSVTQNTFQTLLPVLLVDFCVHDMPVTLPTRPQYVSSSPASCTISLCFEVLSHPILPRGAVRYSRSPSLYFPALVELWPSMQRLYQIYQKRASNARSTRSPRVEKMRTVRERGSTSYILTLILFPQLVFHDLSPPTQTSILMRLPER